MTSASQPSCTQQPLLVALGDAIVDVVYQVPMFMLQEAGLSLHSRRAITNQELPRLLEMLAPYEKSRMGGGSAANSCIAFAQSGGRTRFACALGDDELAASFSSQLTDQGVSVEGAVHSGVPTGTCLALVTPDGSRSMLTCLDQRLSIRPEALEAGRLFEGAAWVLLETYMLSSAHGLETAEQAIRLAHARSAAKIAFTLSDAAVLGRHKSKVERLLPQIDLLIGNEAEGGVLTGLGDAYAVATALSAQVPAVAITAGAKGAFIGSAGNISHVQAKPCIAVDTTGAGDSFTGALLYALGCNLSCAQAGAFAAAFAREVVINIGPHLPKDRAAALKEQALTEQAHKEQAC